jgi:hypothetical protein
MVSGGSNASTLPPDVFREAIESDKERTFEHRVEPIGEWRLEPDGVIVAARGVATHYKWRSANLTVDGGTAAD